MIRQQSGGSLSIGARNGNGSSLAVSEGKFQFVNQRNVLGQNFLYYLIAIGNSRTFDDFRGFYNTLEGMMAFFKINFMFGQNRFPGSGYSAFIRYKNLISLGLGKQCRSNPAFSRSQNADLLHFI